MMRYLQTRFFKRPFFCAAAAVALLTPRAAWSIEGDATIQLPTELPAITSALPDAVVEAPQDSNLGTIGGDFKALETLSLRLDEVRVGQENRLEIFLTLKNVRNTINNLTAGTLNLMITDADGIGYKDEGNVYSASSAKPEILKNAVGIEAEGQVRVRYLFALPKGAVPLKTLTFREHGSEPQTFDISSVKIPKAIEPGITLSSLVGGSGRFAELGHYDVQLDGVKRGRGDTLQAFITLKNASDQLQQFTVSDFKLHIIDGDGISTRNIGNLYRASGGLDPAQISHTILVNPKASSQVRFVFPLKKNHSVHKLTISTHGDAR